LVFQKPGRLRWSRTATDRFRSRSVLNFSKSKILSIKP
jgi:hypothetical protein